MSQARTQPEGVAKSDDSLQVVRMAWEAWERGDMQAVFDFYDPAIEWDMSESEVPDMGVFRGHEGVRNFFREWMAPFHDYYAHAEDFTLGSEGVLVRMKQGGRGKESGVDVEMPPLWQLYRLRAGRAVRVEIYRDEDRAREAAGVRGTLGLPGTIAPMSTGEPERRARRRGA